MNSKIIISFAQEMEKIAGPQGPIMNFLTRPVQSTMFRRRVRQMFPTFRDIGRKNPKTMTGRFARKVGGVAGDLGTAALVGGTAALP